MDVASLSSLPVGVLLWNGPEPTLTVLVKETLAFGPAGFELARAQEPLKGPIPSPFGSALELFHPGDFVPRKARCDVLIAGHAYADAPSLVIGANVRIGSIKKRFYALSSERSVAIPLSTAYLRDEASADAYEVTVGPLSGEHWEREGYAGVESVAPSTLRDRSLPAGFDYGFFNRAPEDQQIEALVPGMMIMLHGLANGGAAVRGNLPTKCPRVLFPDERAGHALREIPLVCDTLWFDTDRRICELTFRGSLSLARRTSLPARLVAVLWEISEALDPARIEVRAGFMAPVRAAEPEDVEDEAIEELAPEDDAEEPTPGAGDDDATPDGDDAATLPPTPAPAFPAAQPVAAAPPAQWSTPVFAGAAAPQWSTEILPHTSEPESPSLDNAPAAKADPERTVFYTGAVPPAKSEPESTVSNNAPSAKSEPEGTLVYTDLPLRRAGTLPFAGGSRPPPPQNRVPPPAAGLPFSSARRPGTTMELEPEDNPVLAALPFDEKPFLRPRTRDVAAELRAPLPFTASTQTLPPPSDEGDQEPRTLAPPPASDDVEPRTLVPPAPRVPAALDDAVPLMASWTTLGPANPTAAPPWAVDLASSRTGDNDAVRLAPKPIEKLGLFTLERDAEIQLALWESAAPLHETLARFDTDELTWREHRRLRDAALREEADAGGSAHALAAHEALENAKRVRNPTGAPSLDLPAYARVRVVIQEAPDEPAALAARGIDLARWEQDHRHYRKRLLKDAAFAEQFRAALEAEMARVGAQGGHDLPPSAPGGLDVSRQGDARPRMPRGVRKAVPRVVRVKRRAP